MKRTRSCILTLLIVVPLLTGCAAYSISPVTGFIYSDVKGPLTATSNTGAGKVGIAQSTSILGLIAQGDSSIETAMKNGGITKIHHVDFHSTGILGVYATFTTTVYGE